MCLSPSELPVELQPCTHIFCRACLEGLTKCPLCSTNIEARHQPHRMIINMLNGLPGKCGDCPWKGTREEFELRHRSSCTGGRAPIISPPVPTTQSSSTSNSGGAAGVTNGLSPGGNSQNSLQRQRSSQASIGDPFGSFGNPWEEYGLSQEEYDGVAAAIAHYVSSRDQEGTNADLSSLDLNGAVRVAAWLNAPYGSNDMLELFRTFNLDPTKDKVNLHQFCVWLATTRRDPQAVYGLTEQMYLSALSYFHSLFPTFDSDFLLDEKKAMEIANLVLQRTVTEVEIKGFFSRKTKVSLHELLSDLKSAHDGWEICGAPVASPVVTAVTSNRSSVSGAPPAATAADSQPKEKEGFFAKLFNRKRSNTEASAQSTITAPSAAPSRVVPAGSPSQRPQAQSMVVSRPLSGPVSPNGSMIQTGTQPTSIRGPVQHGTVSGMYGAPSGSPVYYQQPQGRLGGPMYQQGPGSPQYGSVLSAPPRPTPGPVPNAGRPGSYQYQPVPSPYQPGYPNQPQPQQYMYYSGPGPQQPIYQGRRV